MHCFRSWWRGAAALALLLSISLTLLLSWPQTLPPTATPEPAPVAEAPPPVPAASAPTEGTVQRVAVEAPAVGDAATATPPLTFEQCVDELVAIGRRTAELAQQDDQLGAQDADDTARARFTALLDRFADAGERALAMAATLSSPLQGELDHGRRMVLQLVLAAELQRRDQQATAAGDRSRSDAFTQLVLDTMPSHATATAIGEQVLGDQPWLRAVHEPTVLQFLRLATDGLLPRETATRLLLTLWANLQRTGERSSDELSRLALVLLDDTDPSQRTAACRQLLQDPRYRALVLAWLRERADVAVAQEIANLAARELDAPAALAVLRELGPLLPRATGAWLALGFRAPELVADTYRELLASDTQPGMRCDLVTGLGMSPSPLADQITELALRDDPSPDVRLQAVFAMSTRPDPEVAERALQQALDDRLIAADPTRLGAVVLALQNLEAGGHLNAIDRIGRRLRQMPLAEHSRQTLEGMLARSLPGGRDSTTAR